MTSCCHLMTSIQCIFLCIHTNKWKLQILLQITENVHSSSRSFFYIRTIVHCIRCIGKEDNMVWGCLPLVFFILHVSNSHAALIAMIFHSFKSKSACDSDYNCSKLSCSLQTDRVHTAIGNTLRISVKKERAKIEQWGLCINLLLPYRMTNLDCQLYRS